MKNVLSASSLSSLDSNYNGSNSSRHMPVCELDFESRIMFNVKLPKKKLASAQLRKDDFLVDLDQYKYLNTQSCSGNNSQHLIKSLKNCFQDDSNPETRSIDYEYTRSHTDIPKSIYTKSNPIINVFKADDINANFSENEETMDKSDKKGSEIKNQPITLEHKAENSLNLFNSKSESNCENNLKRNNSFIGPTTICNIVKKDDAKKDVTCDNNNIKPSDSYCLSPNTKLRPSNLKLNLKNNESIKKSNPKTIEDRSTNVSNTSINNLSLISEDTFNTKSEINNNDDRVRFTVNDKVKFSDEQEQKHYNESNSNSINNLECDKLLENSVNLNANQNEPSDIYECLLGNYLSFFFNFFKHV